MQLVKRVVVAATTATAVLADSLPTAPYARIDAASVVAGTKWLLIGGTAALKTSDANYTAATTALGSTITQLDLASEAASAVKTTVNGKSVNRSQVSGQICEYDSNSGKVYCFGGIASTGPLVQGIGAFNPSTSTWEQDHNTDIPLRTGPASVLLGETVYIFGGNDTSDQLPADLQSFSTSDLSSSRVFTNGAYPSGRVGHCIAGLNDTTFLLVGGESAPGKLMNDAWVFDTVGRQWTDVSSEMSDVWPIHRTGVACTKVGEQVALFGGIGSAKAFDDLWLISNTTLKPISRLRKRGFNMWARQTDNGGSAGAPTGRVGAQIANLNNYVGITGGQGANGDSALHFFDAQGNGGWAPSTAALARPLNAAAKPPVSTPAASRTPAAPAASANPVRPAASSTTGRPIATPGQNAGGVPVPVPTRASSSAAAPAASSTRVIPGAGQNAGSAPTSPAAAQATTQAATQAASEPTPAPVVVPLPGQNIGGVPTTAATTTRTSATPSPTKTRVPLVGGGGNDDVDNILLAVLLALPIALAAGLCLLCACFAARRDHKKHANWRQYYRHPETAVREQPVHEHHAVTPMAAATTAGAAAAGAAPVALVNTTTTTVSRTATPIRHTQAPGTPHRSDSRRRVHSPLATGAGAAAGAGAAGGALHTNVEEPARTQLKRYRVLWASTPSQLDEVEAAAGDIVEEKRVFADGWAMVHNITKGATGMIPINILEELPANRT